MLSSRQCWRYANAVAPQAWMMRSHDHAVIATMPTLFDGIGPTKVQVRKINLSQDNTYIYIYLFVAMRVCVHFPMSRRLSISWIIASAKIFLQQEASRCYKKYRNQEHSTYQ